MAAQAPQAELVAVVAAARSMPLHQRTELLPAVVGVERPTCLALAPAAMVAHPWVHTGLVLAEGNVRFFLRADAVAGAEPEALPLPIPRREGLEMVE